MCEGGREVCVCVREGGRCMCMCEGGREVCMCMCTMPHLVLLLSHCLPQKECLTILITTSGMPLEGSPPPY